MANAAPRRGLRGRLPRQDANPIAKLLATLAVSGGVISVMSALLVRIFVGEAL
ncbi:hypothetical protein [Paracoccus sphaerophysae]|uniref:hypothetical protein n=1 Tax=Paracoccus sphaerophysae TaxID=690417 RepID=UPI0012EBBA9A|nr:hypothetical protein [Paracoccus sphaerophysae]